MRKQSTATKQVHRTHSDILEYRFRIEAIFDNKEAREALKQFLEESCTVEPLLFLIEVDQYTRLRLANNRYELAEEIVKHFVSVNAEKELNLPQETRRQVLDRFNALKNGKKSNDEVECPIDLFDKIQSLVFFELKEDSFPRFIKSENFKKFVKNELKRDPNYLMKIGSLKSSLNEAQSGSFVGIEDNISPTLGEEVNYVTESDVEMALKVTAEKVDLKVFDCVVEKNDHQIYISKEGVSLGNVRAVDKNSSVKMFRYDVIIQSDITKLLYFWTKPDSIQKANEHLVEHRFLEFATEANSAPLPYAVSYIFERYSFPLMASREMVFADTVVPLKYSAERNQFDQYIRVRKTVEHPDCPRPKGLMALKRVRANAFNCITIDRKSDGFTRFSIVFIMDFRGFIKNEFLAKIFKKNASEIHENSTKAIRDAQKSPSYGTRPINADGLLEGINYNIKKHFPQEIADKISL